MPSNKPTPSKKRASMGGNGGGQEQQKSWILCQKSGVFFHQSRQSQHDQWLLEEGKGGDVRVPPNHATIVTSSLNDQVLRTQIEFVAKSSLTKWQKFSPEWLRHTLFVSESLMTLINSFMGDFVTLEESGDSNGIKIPFRICPFNSRQDPDKILMVQENLHAFEQPKSWFQLKKIPKSSIYGAKRVILSGDLDEDLASLDICQLMKEKFQNILVTPDMTLATTLLGRTISFKVKKVDKVDLERDFDIQKHMENLSLSAKYCQVLPSTSLVLEQSRKATLNPKSCLEGLDSKREEVLSVIQSKEAHGILIWGPTGTGKSDFCREIPAFLAMNEIIVNSSELFSKFIGETQDNLRNVFRDAKKKQPCIIFIDDIDALCGSSDQNEKKSDQERRTTLTLISCLDEVSRGDLDIFILASTNRMFLLDSNLRRPGRFEREIEFPVPDVKQRKLILQQVLSNSIVTEDTLEEVSKATHAFVGADLKALVNQGLKISKGDSLTMKHFDEALKVVKPSAMKEVLIEVPNVSWSDIGGLDELKKSLQQTIEWPSKMPNAFARLGINPPKGLLMYGPPGCSKTMIAKALANESRHNFLAIKGPELFSKWVGESEKAVRELFRKARQVAPAIIFFDEIDALGSERGGAGSGKVGDRVLAQMLTEMDGIEQLKDVTIVAATNRPDMIDPALLRPGRLDRIFFVPLPEESTRRRIFEVHTSNKPLASDVDLNKYVKGTGGYSGAEIASVCNEAAIKALEENHDAKEIHDKHFLEALELVKPRTNPKLLEVYDEFLQKRLS